MSDRVSVESFVKSLPLAVAMFDREMRYLAWSPRWVSDYALKEAQLDGRSHYDIFPDLPERWKEIHRRCLAGGMERCDEDRFPRTDGRTEWLRWEVRPWKDDRGQVGGLVMFTENITARKVAESRYQDLYDQAPDLLYSVDLNDGRILECNRSFADALGWSKQELLGRCILELYTPESALEARRVGERFKRTGEVRDLELQVVRKDGRILDVSLIAIGVLDAAGHMSIGRSSWRDISERKRDERLLSAQFSATQILARADNAASALDDILRAIGESWAWDVAALWKAATKTDTLRASSIWRRNPETLKAFAAETLAKDFRRGEGLPGRTWASGEPQWIEDIQTDPNIPRAPIALREGLKSAFSFPLLLKGEFLGVMEFFSVERRPADPQILKLMSAIGSQVAQFLKRTQAEAEALRRQEELRQSQKMEAVGRLAGGIAHDFNNILTAVIGHTDLVLQRLPEGSDLRDDLVEILRGGQRAGDLTRQLLAFSRRQILEPRVLDLNVVILELEKMLRRLIGEHIDLVTRLRPGVGHVRSDPGQMEQILINLSVNARDAMPGGGKLTIDTDLVELDAAYAEANPGVTPGPHVRMAVSDTGHGMDAETLSHLFEPFFTTKPKGKGTGLGLPMVYGIVKQSGGHLSVYSERGRGTTFKVYFPRALAPLEASRPAPAPVSPAPTGRELILLVEDDEAVRRISRAILQKAGYALLEATNGADALKLAEAHASPIPLMVTDVVMPGMSGRELATRLLERHPETKVLFVSGYTEDAIVHHGVLEPGLSFLPKPFTPDAMQRKVREILGPAKP